MHTYTTEDLTTEKHIHQIIVPVRSPERPKRSLVDRILNRPIPEPETSRTLTFRPAVIVNASRIAEACMKLPNEIWEQEHLNLPLMYEHQPQIVYIVAAALQNNYLEPAPELIKFLQLNLSGEQLGEGLAASIQALGLDSFLKCVMLVKPTVRILNPDYGVSEQLETQLTDLTNSKN